MIKIDKETNKAFQNTADPKAAEKDYYECAVLDELFRVPYFSDNFVFAGGGSITKSYKLCQRTAQDLDLSCQTFEKLPDVPTKRELIKFKRRFKEYVFDDVKYRIHASINQQQQFMIMSDRDWHVLENKEQYMSFPTLHLLYKSKFDAVGHICIEMIPRRYAPGSVYLRTVVPYSTGCAIGRIPTVCYEQTFWDKVYALHCVATEAAPRLRECFSRHYYDVAQMSPRINLWATQHMLADIEAYQQRHTTKAVAPISSMQDVKLIPNNSVLARLENDYRELSRISIQAPVSWESIICTLQRLNNKINSL